MAPPTPTPWTCSSGNANDAVRDVLVETLDVNFDSEGGADDFDFAREAAHSDDRILHVDASTGKHVHVRS